MSVAFTASTREVLEQIVRDARFRRLTQIPLLASMPIQTIVGAYLLFAVATYLWLQGELPLVAMLLLNGFAIYAAFTPLHDATHRTVSRSLWLNDLLGTIRRAPWRRRSRSCLEHRRVTTVQCHCRG